MKQIFLKAWLILACLLVGVGETWGETIEINTTNSGVTGSYADKTFKVSNVTFGFTQWMKNTNIQAKKSTTNSCYNVDAIPGNIKKITVVQTGTARAITMYGGTSGKPTTKIQSPTTAATMEFDFTGENYTYFSMTTPGNAVYINTITIEYETTGGDPTKTTPTLSFAAPTYNATVGETFTAPELTNPDGVAVTYASSQTSVATVNSSTGAVTLVAPGETKITASFAGDATRNPASANYNLIVAENIADKTIAEFIASGGGKCYLTGIVSNIKNTTYGNFDLTDESGTIYVYGCLDTDKQKGKFSNLDVVEGDKIKVLAESYEYYQNTTHEAKDVIFVEEIPYEKPKYTVTIEDAMNGTLTVKEGATVLASGDQVELGKTLTIECSPYDGYRYEGWYYKEDGDWVTMTDVMTHVVTKDITITASFGEIPAYTVAWSVNGEVVDSKVYAEGATVTAPENPSDINGKVFTGWVASEIDGVVNDVPSYVTPTTATADVTYYAVFATKISEVETSLTKLNGTSVLAEGDNIVVVAESGENSYVMYQETISTSYVNYKSLDHAPLLADVKDDAKMSWTLTAAKDGTWKLGDAVNGYLLNSAGTNNLYADTKEYSSVTIAWDDTESKFTIKNGDRWIACRTDLTSNQYKFRGGGTSTISGTVYFDFYRYIAGSTTYSDFCTTVPTPVEPTYTPEVLALVAQNEEGYYATFSSSEVTFWSEDYVVSAVGVEAGTLYKFDNDEAFDQGTVEIESESVKGYYVPANTGVLVYSIDEVASYYTVTGVTPSNDVAAVNMLVPTTSTTCPVVAGDNLYYKLAYGDATAKKNLGFWWGAEDGSSNFNVKAGGAVLVVPASAGSVRGFSFGGEDTTGIENLMGANEAQGAIYNLQGVRMQKLVRGVNIIDGRKVLR